MRIPLFIWVFLVSLLGILIGFDVGFVCGQCQRGQQSFLLQLNESLKYNHNKSTRLARWDTHVDCCEWRGVKCDEGGLGRVVGLYLSNESISGGLENSRGLFSLRFLQNLDLSFNNFNTIMPARFANLTDLVYLNLSNAGFTGQIPLEISKLARLVTLDLSMLYFPGVASLKLENPKLATLVQNFTQLEELRLDGVNVSAKGHEWCRALSSSLTNLRVLSLSNCFLSGPIDSSLSQLKSLSVLRLSKNNLSTSVPEFFANFLNLSALQLSSCELSGIFPESIFQLPSLQILDLQNNNKLQGSLPEFHQNLSLQTILLSYTNFSGTLPLSIGGLAKLSRIELDNCSFSGPIPSSMENLTQLVYLDFSANSLTGSIPSFCMSRNLTHIDFSHNNLTGEISSTHWETLMNLIYIDLRYNSFNGNIPSSLFAISSLQKILLSFNRFEGSVPEFANASFSSLDTLDLSGNKLEGSVPKSVFVLQKLNVLTLSSNKFNGTTSIELIQKLGNLTTLDLSYNNLTVDTNASSSTRTSASFFSQIKTIKLASCNLRQFPDLRNQTKLFYLDLSGNQINGAVPKWVWEVGVGSLVYLNVSGNHLDSLEGSPKLSNLAVLDLSNNQLRGKIPTPPQTATFVDYSNNKFTSFIPPDISSNLTFTYFLSLANNSITGVIPASICNAIYLEVLDLSNNNLGGTIPECLIGRSGTLAVLNLRRNNFQGKIPDAFPADCELKTLDVSANQLVGKVSRSLANCNALEVLDLGNNQINDVFPCHLKNISSFRVLILRSNKFYGSIGCPKNNSTWAKLQIVDIAANNFTGFLPDKCLATWEAMIRDEKDTGDTIDHLSFNPLKLTGGSYYQDSITVISKGFEVDLVKILTVFTSIDFSSNSFEGPIPEVIGNFTALRLLNLSHNSLTGKIPSSLGNLSLLESIDLSSNQLSGEIPSQLAGLTFLSVLNLSHNQLVGKIPTGNQLRTFNQDSYEANKGLCGPPLENNCTRELKPTYDVIKYQRNEFNWQFIVSGVGFGLGAGAVMAPLLFWKKANEWYDDQIDKILLVLLPLFGLRYYTSNDWRIEPEENSEEEDTTDEDDEDDEEEENDDLGGRYCVFCTKLDIMRKRAIHDPNCTCYHSPPLSSASSVSSSSYSSTS